MPQRRAGCAGPGAWVCPGGRRGRCAPRSGTACPPLAEPASSALPSGMIPARRAVWRPLVPQRRAGCAGQAHGFFRAGGAADAPPGRGRPASSALPSGMIPARRAVWRPLVPQRRVGCAGQGHGVVRAGGAADAPPGRGRPASSALPSGMIPARRAVWRPLVPQRRAESFRGQVGLGGARRVRRSFHSPLAAGWRAARTRRVNCLPQVACRFGSARGMGSMVGSSWLAS